MENTALKEEPKGDDLERELEQKSSFIEKLLSQNRELTKQKEYFEKLFNEVTHSTSWKITAPIRALAELKRTIFPLLRWRRFPFSLREGRNTTVNGSSVTILGQSPRISLVPLGSQSPSKWVTLEASITPLVPMRYIFLYFRTGETFNDGERVWLTFVDGKPLPAPFWIPKGVKEFRLDPFESEGSFVVDSFTIREIGSIQLIWHFLSKYFFSLIRNPGQAFIKIKRAVSLVRAGGIEALRVKLFAQQLTNNYQEWVERFDTLSTEDIEKIGRHIESFSRRPKISILMPTYNTPEEWLRKAIDSVLGQIYQEWELCIADDASTEPHVRSILKEYEEKNHRIKVTFRETNGHIAKASNDALSLATGDFVALLDHDDELSPHALYMIANEVNESPTVGFIYSDEDKLTGYGMRFNPYFKSDWNPDLLLSQNYVCHLSVFRSDILRSIGGFRDGVDGAQDWDLILRATEKLSENEIRHIPHVLYHWRVIEGSTAQSTTFKPYVLESQKRTVEEHLRRRGEKASVEILPAISHLKTTFEVPTPKPLVSIIIPSRDQKDILSRCLNSITAKSTYKNIEFIVVNNGSVEPDALQYLNVLRERSNFRVIEDRRPFNFSRLNNDAAKIAKGEILAFLNNDLEVISPDWLSEMVSHAARSGVGAVGARLLYPNGLLQHGGIIIGIGGVAGHNHKGRLRTDPGYFNRAILTQNLSAVTAACMVLRRDVFEEVGGFDEERLTVAFNDVDLCLRIREKGYRIVYTPYAELFHYESISRGYENTPEKFNRFESEIRAMKKKWGDTLKFDPYYNPNLTFVTEDFSFAFPPRVKKPWG